MPRRQHTAPRVDEPVRPLHELMDELEQRDREAREAMEKLRAELADVIQHSREQHAAGPPPPAAPAPAIDEPPAEEPPPPPAIVAPAPPPAPQTAFDFAAPPAAATKTARRRAAPPPPEEPMPSTSKFGAQRLSPRAVEILGSVDIDGDLIVLTCGQIPRKLYEEIDAALHTIGATWKRHRRGHLVEDPESVRERLEAIVTTGTFLDAKKLYQAFYTPMPLARRAVSYAEIAPGQRLLEPSAGRGALADAILETCMAVRLTLVEAQPESAQHLRQRFTGAHQVIEGDFLTKLAETAALVATAPNPIGFDRVVMNPPFTAPGRPQADLDHVRFAFELLQPGGLLVAIMSNGVTFRGNRATQAFRDEVLRYGDVVERVPPGTFAESGTDVPTVIVKLRRPGR